MPFLFHKRPTPTEVAHCAPVNAPCNLAVCLLILFAAALAWLGVAGTLAASEIPTPSELLTILRAKDDQVDNVRIQYAYFGVDTTKRANSALRQETAEEMGEDAGKAHEFHFRYVETMIIRGPHATFIREADPTFSDDSQAETGESMVPYQKWSNTEGMSRAIAISDGVPSTMRIDIGGFPVDSAQEDAMGIEFAFGFGFGKRIKTIDRIQQDGSRLRVDGTIQIWWADESRFQLTLDEHYLVREAEIESVVEGNHTRFEVKTDGFVAIDHFEFAKTGSFKRINLGRKVDGELVATPKIADNVNIEFQEIESNLSDEAYHELVAMTPEAGTQVSDLINDKWYVVGDEQGARPLRPRVDSEMHPPGHHPGATVGPRRSWPGLYLILYLLAACLFVLILLGVRNRRSRRLESRK